LIEAFGMVHVEGRDTLLVAYDLPAPEPLWAKRPLAKPFGVALLLSREARNDTLGRIDLEFTGGVESSLENGALEQLRRSNPAARALPLLFALARRAESKLGFAWTNDGIVRIGFTPVGYE
jgi:hypothetical protein